MPRTLGPKVSPVEMFAYSCAIFAALAGVLLLFLMWRDAYAADLPALPALLWNKQCAETAGWCLNDNTVTLNGQFALASSIPTANLNNDPAATLKTKTIPYAGALQADGSYKVPITDLLYDLPAGSYLIWLRAEDANGLTSEWRGVAYQLAQTIPTPVPDEPAPQPEPVPDPEPEPAPLPSDTTPPGTVGTINVLSRCGATFAPVEKDAAGGPEKVDAYEFAITRRGYDIRKNLEYAVDAEGNDRSGPGEVELIPVASMSTSGDLFVYYFSSSLHDPRKYTFWVRVIDSSANVGAWKGRNFVKNGGQCKGQ